ncbi:MAG: hypothetical protein Roseis2KO_19590 [Roseivirga sp.]
MSFKVRYSLRARHEEIKLLEYIVEGFGRKKAKEVYERIEKVLDHICNVPEMYPVSKQRSGLRKCVFSKQTSIYYQINKDYIEIVSFRPNRSDPKKFKV